MKWTIGIAFSRVWLLAGLLTFLMTGFVNAGVTVLGAEVEMSWTEPDKNKDGSGLKDLKETGGTYQVDPSGTEILCGSMIPATTVTGGGQVSTKCTVPLPQDSEADVTFRARAHDLSGNLSEPAVEVKRIDSLAPGSPLF